MAAMTIDGPGPGAGIDGSGSALATCVLAPNPSPMTLDGTNTWLIAAPDSTVALVVDPGPDDEGHLRRVVQQAGQAGRRIAQILLTHGHEDHSAGARREAGPARRPDRPDPAPPRPRAPLGRAPPDGRAHRRTGPGGRPGPPA